MAAKLLIGIPSKGRLKDAAADLFARSGLALRNAGHERRYRGAMSGLDDVEVVYASAAEIVDQLKAGRIHLGVTGEDLIRETIGDVDGAVTFLAPLGFGRADVVVAVPDCWIDVVRTADLEDVAAQFVAVHGRRLRVATKYMNLTRRFFASHGVAGYRIVESAGATEATPAAGTAELIVDITTTGATLAANGLKVIEDGIILRSQANLIASRQAAWGPQERECARIIFDRITAQARAGEFREVRTRLLNSEPSIVAEAQKLGALTPFGGPSSTGMFTLHAPKEKVHALANLLREKGADGVTVGRLDYVFVRDNPLYTKLEAGL
jgi:ATP phosphoribosyltransferase